MGFFRRSSASLASVLAILLAAASAHAFGFGITTVTVDDPDKNTDTNLETLSVGGLSASVLTGQLITGTSSGGNCGGGFPPTNADGFELSQSFASLCATGGQDTMETVSFGGLTLYSDMNGSLPDFFIFENGGNDSGTIRAILADDSLGDPVSFVPGDFGDTGLDSKFNQNIKGLAFSITELLDGDGNNLTLADSIKGIQIQSDGVDPSSISAYAPEPSTGTLCAIGLLGLAWLGRRRHH